MNSAFELNSYTFIDLIGADCEKFLQGQLSVNATEINANTAQLSALCNHKGRIVSLFHIHQIAEGFRLILPQEIAASTIAHIKKYAVFFKVEVKLSDDSFRLMATIIDPQQPVNNNELTDRAVIIPNTQLSIFVTDKSTLLDEIAISSNYLYLTSDNLWYRQLASNHIPWLTSSSVEQFLPHNLDLPKLSAVDFNKGCFTGQEVIARMQYKGKLKQHMQLLRCKKQLTLSPKDKLIQYDKAVGEVICSTSQQQETLVLALLKDSVTQNESFLLNLENSPILELVE